MLSEIQIFQKLFVNNPGSVSKLKRRNENKKKSRGFFVIRLQAEDEVLFFHHGFMITPAASNQVHVTK